VIWKLQDPSYISITIYVIKKACKLILVSVMERVEQQTTPAALKPFRNPRRLIGLLEHLVLLVFTSAGFIVIILVALATPWAEASFSRSERLNSWLLIDVSTTLTAVRILQGLIATTTSIALIRSFFCVEWFLLKKPNGLSYCSYLALSPTTLDWGTFRLIASPSASIHARLGGISRYREPTSHMKGTRVG
jgi:hypothetical protein